MIMQVPTSTDRRSTGANMTPMIDVVFLLIIFFLVSSHLARQETRLPLDLPTAATFQSVDPDNAPLTISVADGTRVLVGGKQVDQRMLKSILSDLVDRAGADAAVRIRTDGQVQYRYIEPVLRAAALAGVTDAAIAVREPSTVHRSNTQ